MVNKSNGCTTINVCIIDFVESGRRIRLECKTYKRIINCQRFVCECENSKNK